MQSSDLSHIINVKFPSISKNFKGVYSINNVPKKISKNHYVIVNTDEANEPGKHWFCFIKKDTKKYELFDSLGINDMKLDKIKQFKLFPIESVVKYNENAVQDFKSTTCGLFVLYFLIHRMHNIDMSLSDLINDIFDADVKKNELMVESFSNDHFK